MAVFSHFIEYGFDGQASVDDVVASLKANETLLLETANVLQLLVPGLNVVQSTVLVRRVIQESPLKEYLALAVVLTYQKDLEQEVPELIESLTGQQVPVQYDGIITVLVMIIAIYGISKLIERLFPRRKNSALDADRDQLVADVARRLNLSPLTVTGAMDVATSGRNRGRIERAARRFFQPIIGKDTTGVHSGDKTISPAAIAEIPSEVELAVAANDEPDTVRTEMLRRVKISLHATDRDRAKAGWAGHIVGKKSGRIKMILDKDIPPERLFGRRQVIGDVLMVYDVDDGGNETPREFHLLSIN